MKSEGDFCTNCRRKKPFFSRAYSGEKLCRRCFTRSLEEKVRITIAQYKMLSYNDNIAVAVSGGKDSVNLLYILARMENKFPKASLSALTVDEGIKGYRDEALKIASDSCQELEVRHVTVSFQELYGHTLDEIIKKRDKTGIRTETACAICGVLRRRALNVAGHRVGANKIATAHTLDDETQTILLNILHGDIARTAREKPVTEKISGDLIQRIKPFCTIPEEETALYAYLRKVRFQSTPCPYASEALRNDVRLILNRLERKRPGTKFTIYKSLEKMRSTLEMAGKKETKRKCITCGEPTSETKCRVCQILEEMNVR